MQCPIDRTDLVISDRQGIEIDYCPQCRGVWLDRGELDKIIERATAVPAAPGPGPGAYDERRGDRGYDDRRPEGRGYDDRRPPERAPRGRYDDDHYRYGRYDDDRYRYGRKRKGSFLGELFDF